MENNTANNMNSQKRRKELLDILRAIDFALYDTILYLDAYPESEKALDFYNSLIEDRDVVRDEYQMKYGPLTAYENGSDTEWRWTDEPWPWQIDANI